MGRAEAREVGGSRIPTQVFWDPKDATSFFKLSLLVFHWKY